MSRPRSQGSASIEFIDSAAKLRRLLKAIGKSDLLAVDTEAASFHRYQDRVYLVQLSTRERSAVIDPLAVRELGGLGDLLNSSKTEIVFHDADYDLRLLDRDLGIRVTRIFDTRIAAQFLNEPAVGLAALLEKHLGVRLDKKFQRADWSARPLSPEMVEYASKDTQFLPALRDLLRAHLDESGRLAWVEEEFALLERVRWKPPARAKEGYLKLKGAKALRNRQLAILRELYQWRERTAKRVDRAPFRIMNNEPLVMLAKSPPADVEGLRTVRGIGNATVDRRGKEILRAISRGLELPEDKLPRINRPARPESDPASEARLDRLKAARNRIARRLELAPGVLCPNGTLEAIARAAPTTLPALRRADGVRQWQSDVFGEELLEELKAG